MLLYEVSANGADWTSQWLTDEDVEDTRKQGYVVRCSFCKKLSGLTKPNDSVVMTPGKYTEIRVNMNGDHHLVIAAVGDSDRTESFPMNFCPKCGAKV